MTGLNREQTQTFEENLHLAYWVAHRYGHGILPRFDDRVQAARIGLWKAVLRYDPTRAKLVTFAVRVMMHEIHRAGKTEAPVGTVRLEHVQAVLAAPGDASNPEHVLLRREEKARLADRALAMPRKRRRKGATWTAADVVRLIDGGHRPADVARMFGVSRQRVHQIVRAIRAAQPEKGVEGYA